MTDGPRPVLVPDVVPSRHWLDPAWAPLWEAIEGLDVVDHRAREPGPRQSAVDAGHRVRARHRRERSRPDSVEILAKQRAGVSESDVRAITHDNAARFFGFTV